MKSNVGTQTMCIQILTFAWWLTPWLITHSSQVKGQGIPDCGDRNHTGSFDLVNANAHSPSRTYENHLLLEV